MFDLSNPTVQVALLALGGAILAGGAGFGGAVVGARIAASAAREAARLAMDQAEAARQEARQANERDYARSLQEKLHAKGDKAAEAILDLMNELDLGPFSFWEAMAKRGGDDAKLPFVPPEPTQAELEPFVVKIQRYAITIEKEQVRKALDAIAVALYGYDTVREMTGESAWRVWWLLHQDAKAVLGAYIRGESIPQTPEADRLNGALTEWHEMTGE